MHLLFSVQKVDFISNRKQKTKKTKNLICFVFNPQKRYTPNEKLRGNLHGTADCQLISVSSLTITSNNVCVCSGSVTMDFVKSNTLAISYKEHQHCPLPPVSRPVAHNQGHGLDLPEIIKR